MFLPKEKETSEWISKICNLLLGFSDNDLLIDNSRGRLFDQIPGKRTQGTCVISSVHFRFQRHFISLFVTNKFAFLIKKSGHL